MKYILLSLIAYDCGQEYELDNYNVLLETDESSNEHARSIISNYLKRFYEIEDLPESVEDDVAQYKLTDEGVSLFNVDYEFHYLDYVEMVHIEVSKEYIDIYKGEGL